MNLKEYFNNAAETWDDICYHDKDKIFKMIDLCQIQKGSKVLDMGTGTGVMIPYLNERIGLKGNIVAVDMAEKMIEKAKMKNNLPNVDFIVGDILTLNFPSEFFDIIMCYSVFPHFEDQFKVIKKMESLLKEGGKLVICHSQSRERINSFHKNSSKEVSNDILPETYIIKNYFSKCGLETTTDVDDDNMFLLIGYKSKKTQ